MAFSSSSLDLVTWKHANKVVLSLAALTSLWAVAYTATKIPEPASRKIIPSPRVTLIPRLSPSQKQALAYPPDLLPGARDVNTPHGVMRVYEWGPEDGDKVIMVHGDATPAPMFTPIANGLVKKGCRVMLIDLWGRGYSDTPADSQHDSRLYSLQILFAITSSPLAWTGDQSGGFSIIGFSMGGSITMDFLGTFPSLVNSIVLLGPAGLLRDLPTEYKSAWYWHPSVVPKSYMRSLIGNLLGVDLRNQTTPKSLDGKTPTIEPDPAALVQFQFDHHIGHVHSFLNNLQYGPLQNQHAIWQRASRVIRGNDPAASRSKLSGGKILVICGAQDDVVPAAHVREDLHQLLGGYQHFTFATVPGGHGFPYPQGGAIVEHIADFWKLTS